MHLSSDFKKAAVDDLATQYIQASVKSLMAQMTLLNPRFKEFRYIHDREEWLKIIAHAKSQLLINTMLSKLTMDQLPTADDGEESPAKKMRKHEDAIFKFLTSVMGSQSDDKSERKPKKTVSTRITKEMEMYVEEKVDGNIDPIAYWNQATTLFPLLQRSCSASCQYRTQVFPVIAFSHTGLIVDDLQSQSSPEKVNFLCVFRITRTCELSVRQISNFTIVTRWT